MMHTKILIRPENFHLRYQHWHEKESPVHLEMLRGSYANEVFGMGSDDLTYEHSSQYARITWHPGDLQIEALSCLLDHFRNVMLKNNYYIQISDERNEVFDSGLKLTIHRHYLKPDRLVSNGLADETPLQFGNIFLEHRFNSRYNALCISSNYYGDRTYTSFEKLMEVLLS